MQDGFLRAAAASIPWPWPIPGAMRPRSVRASTRRTAHNAALLVLPELCVTATPAATCFCPRCCSMRPRRRSQASARTSQNCDPVVVLGVPLRAGGKLYNCAAVLHRGRILGVVPKTWLPNYDVFAEKALLHVRGSGQRPRLRDHRREEVPFGAGWCLAARRCRHFASVWAV